jgi:hypothetical protein
MALKLEFGVLYMCVYKICGLVFFKETVSFALHAGNLNIILQRITEEK